MESRYLSRNSTELIGHTESFAQLCALYQRGQLPHAILISGQEGIGKATFAYHLARYILHDGKQVLDPEHPINQRITSASHGDLLVLDGDNIKVEETREVGEFLHLTPSESRFRVVIVDALDQLNQNGANCLLKLIEEPPKHTLLLLVCHALYRILPTIRSRCYQLALRPLSEEHMNQLLAGLLPDKEIAPELSQMMIGRPGLLYRFIENGGKEVYEDVSLLLNSLPAIDRTILNKIADKFTLKDNQHLWAFVLMVLSWFIKKQQSDAVEHHRDRIPAYDDLWNYTGKLFLDTEQFHLDKKLAFISWFSAYQRCYSQFTHCEDV